MRETVAFGSLARWTTRPALGFAAMNDESYVEIGRQVEATNSSESAEQKHQLERIQRW